MASRRGLSVNVDTIDLAMVMKAFEQMNQVVLVGRMRVENVRGSDQVTILWEAHSAAAEIGEVPCLGSVKCHLGQGNHLTVESAIMWSLYQLDAQIARLELGVGQTK